LQSSQKLNAASDRRQTAAVVNFCLGWVQAESHQQGHLISASQGWGQALVPVDSTLNK